MEKFWLIVLLFLCVMVSSCNRAAYDENTKAIEVKAGAEFVLKLPSNPSTGYKWFELRPIDTNFLHLKLVDFKGEHTRSDGAGGHELWIFEAAKAGETSIDLHYWQPWDSTSSADTLSIHVRVY